MPATQTQVKQMTATSFFLSNIFTGKNKMSCSPGQKGGGWSRWVGWWSHISSRTRHRNWPCLGIWTEGNIILDLTHLHCHYCFLSISLYSPLLKLKASREYTEPSVSCLLFLLRQLEGRGVTVMRLNIRWRWCSVFASIPAPTPAGNIKRLDLLLFRFLLKEVCNEYLQVHF